MPERITNWLFDIDPKKLWIRYVLGMLAILALVYASHYQLDQAVVVGENDAQLINVSGRQRMLSQRILYFSNAVKDKHREEDYMELGKAIDLFETSHNYLSNHEMVSGDLKENYFGSLQGPSLDSLSRDYVRHARIIADPQSTSIEESFNALEALGPKILLGRLNEAVQQFENLADEHALVVQSRVNLTLNLAVVLIILEGILIFLPAQRAVTNFLARVEKQKRRLKEQHEILLERNKELDDARAEIEREALTDYLTGLVNRRGLNLVIQKHREEQSESKQKLAVLHIDLDRFKQINDTLGHAAGDFILVHVSKVLSESMLPGDVAARIGGDEFVILATHNTEREFLAARADRIIEELGKPVTFEDEICHFGASIGIDIGIVREDVSRIETSELLVNADIALYEAKKTGRGRYCFYGPDLKNALNTAKTFADDLVTAITKKEFEAWYQPLYDTKSMQIVAIEALARWKTESGETLNAADFMATLEEVGQLRAFDEAMVQIVANDINEWLLETGAVKTVSVNLSEDTLLSKNLEKIVAPLIPFANTIAFEVPESAASNQNHMEWRTAISILRNHNFRVEIDNFGSSYASIMSVDMLRPDMLKISKDLVIPSKDNSRRARIVSDMVNLAHSQGIPVVAEGIESADHLELVKEMGCDFIQGFALARPLPRGELASVLGASALFDKSQTETSEQADEEQQSIAS